MEATPQEMQQIVRMLRKIAQKFPPTDEPSLLTDIHIRVSQDSGEMTAFNDDDVEITRCVVDGWIENKDGDFYENAAAALRAALEDSRQYADGLGILKPYSFILEDDERLHVAELYISDGDTVILGGELMQGLSEDLDNFIAKLTAE